jgi:methionyl-tRNA formyltransferase
MTENWSQWIMTKTSETIIFFGSGPVAAESLRRLADDFDIEVVITKPKPEHHKHDFPVITLAEELGLDICTVTDKQTLSDLFKNRTFNSRLGVVIDFGILIGKDVIESIPLGIVNSHFSLLPKLRGADPISFAILEDQDKTGVSLMLIVEALDEGPLIAQQSISMDGHETTPELTARLIELSHNMLEETLPKFLNGEIKPYPQEETPPATYTRKLYKKDGQLDWNKPANALEKEIRAFIEWPRSRTIINGVSVIVTKAHTSDKSGPLGQIWSEGKELGVYTSEGSLVIDMLIPAGKKEMPAASFLAGYKI